MSVKHVVRDADLVFQSKALKSESSAPYLVNLSFLICQMRWIVSGILFWGSKKRIYIKEQYSIILFLFLHSLLLFIHSFIQKLNTCIFIDCQNVQILLDGSSLSFLIFLLLWTCALALKTWKISNYASCNSFPHAVFLINDDMWFQASSDVVLATRKSGSLSLIKCVGSVWAPGIVESETQNL